MTTTPAQAPADTAATASDPDGVHYVITVEAFAPGARTGRKGTWSGVTPMPTDGSTPTRDLVYQWALHKALTGLGETGPIGGGFAVLAFSAERNVL